MKTIATGICTFAICFLITRYDHTVSSVVDDMEKIVSSIQTGTNDSEVEFEEVNNDNRTLWQKLNAESTKVSRNYDPEFDSDGIITDAEALAFYKALGGRGYDIFESKRLWVPSKSTPGGPTGGYWKRNPKWKGHDHRTSSTMLRWSTYNRGHELYDHGVRMDKLRQKHLAKNDLEEDYRNERDELRGYTDQDVEDEKRRKWLATKRWDGKTVGETGEDPNRPYFWDGDRLVRIPKGLSRFHPVVKDNPSKPGYKDLTTIRQETYYYELGEFFDWSPRRREAANFLHALLAVESNGNLNAVGDGGASIGGWQIQLPYYIDAKQHEYRILRMGKFEPTSEETLIFNYRKECYRNVRAHYIVKMYMLRYEPEAWSIGNWEILAKLHNGGPNWRNKTGEAKENLKQYWKKVRAAMDHIEKVDSRRGKGRPIPPAVKVYLDGKQINRNDYS